MASEASAIEALVTEGLTRRYGQRTAVDALSIRILEGDVYGFLGPNGAGKTTAIRCILGLIRRDAGSVRIFGESDPVRQRRHVGAMVETPAFHQWMTGRANLERAAAFSGLGDIADIDRVLDLVGLAGRDREKVRGYSLGMRQRLGIARALIGRPRLLVLDEPTNGLDPRGMKEVRDLLAHLAREESLTIFVSSHLLSEIEQLATRVGIIEHGKLVREGTVAELVGSAGQQQVDVTVTDAYAAQRVIADLAGASVVAEGPPLRVALDGVDISGLNRALVSGGVGVCGLSPVQRSLEELFLSLTSAELT